MKKFYSCVIALVLFIVKSAAQPDQQFGIHTNEGIVTISQTADNRDKTTIAIKVWDRMVAGTKYTSGRFAFFKSRKLCIEIAIREKGNCTGGIGFGCSIYDCPDLADNLVNRVDADSRVCAVLIKKIKGAMEIIFLDKVNWKSLAEG